MRREQRLRASDDYSRVRREGRSWAVPLLVLYAARRSLADAPTRVGITAGRRVGGAVVRNKVRRRVREAVRSRYDELACGWDLVFIVRPRASDAEYVDVAEAVETLLGRAGVVWAERSCRP